VLRDLYVRDLAVLAEVAVSFGPGLNVLSGETGAGKSLLVDSLALLAGARASTDLIRTGAERLSVSGLFEPASDAWRATLEEAGIEAGDEGSLVVRREIARQGPNRVFVNDQPASVKLLADLAPQLLRIHTQREELGLFSPELQRSWLDRSGGAPGTALVARVAEAWGSYSEAAERLERSRGDQRLRAERIDLLRFQGREIDAARLETDEELELRRERDLLRNSESVAEALGAAHALLAEDEGAAIDRLAQAARHLEEIAAWVPEGGEWMRELAELGIRLEEVGRALRDRLDGVEADPGRLNAVEERLAAIERLCRKYGGGSRDVLDVRARIAEELGDLEGDDERREELEARAARALESYRAAALDLSARRVAWGASLADRVHAELADLAMAKARFAVRVERRLREGSALEVEGAPVEFGAGGIDTVTFELAANPGEEAGPLSRVASGGELSRVYLALQLAVGGAADARPTLVYDEVDAGIGGAQAAALGRKLQRLADERQILVVTHLPQVASFADRHLGIRKRVARGRTEMGVEVLGEADRVEEVARMLAGRRVTELSRSHAEEMIAGAARGRR
jgi:DNA repair protein RecN (Recombination protein N)